MGNIMGEHLPDAAPTLRPGRGAPGKRRRPGGGRKRKPADPFVYTLSTRLTEQDGQTLEAWAKLLDVDKAELARDLIAAGLREKQFV